MYGGVGDDVLNGTEAQSSNPGRGDLDSLTGYEGSDKFILGDANAVYYDDGDAASAGSNDYAYIADFDAATDKVQLRGSASNYRLEVILSGSGSPYTNLYFDKAGSEPDELIARFGGVTNLNLNSPAFEYITPPPTGITLNGTAGRDTLNGTSGDDTLYGLGNNDILNGLEGNDRLEGGDGNDTLNGGLGNDSLYGGLGNDTYFVDSASDAIFENLNEGTDTVNASVDVPTRYATSAL